MKKYIIIIAIVVLFLGTIASATAINYLNVNSWIIKSDNLPNLEYRKFIDGVNVCYSYQDLKGVAISCLKK